MIKISELGLVFVIALWMVCGVTIAGSSATEVKNPENLTEYTKETIKYIYGKETEKKAKSCSITCESGKDVHACCNVNPVKCFCQADSQSEINKCTAGGSKALQCSISE